MDVQIVGKFVDAVCDDRGRLDERTISDLSENGAVQDMLSGALMSVQFNRYSDVSVLSALLTTFTVGLECGRRMYEIPDGGIVN